MCLSLQYHTELVLCPNQPLHSHIHPPLPLKNAVSLSSVIKDVFVKEAGQQHLASQLGIRSPPWHIFNLLFQTFSHTWHVLPLDVPRCLPALQFLLLPFFIDAGSWGHCIFFLSFVSAHHTLPCLSKVNTTFFMKPSVNSPLLQCWHNFWSV